MRVVRDPDELPRSLGAARREAMGAFDDDRIYLEKLVENARHIEFQILADSHGNTIHLGERECSIQRRHQKLIEESPSPVLTPQLRAEMGAAAVRAVKWVNYEGAGTIKFLYSDGDYYFLKKITPSPGKLRGYRSPGGIGIRVDSGVYTRYTISPIYDPMISKLIAWGRDRDEAIARMRRALYEYIILGVKTNIPFHKAVMENPRFINGDLSTHFIETEPTIIEDMKKIMAREK